MKLERFEARVLGRINPMFVGPHAGVGVAGKFHDNDGAIRFWGTFESVMGKRIFNVRELENLVEEVLADGSGGRGLWLPVSRFDGNGRAMCSAIAQKVLATVKIF